MQFDTEIEIGTCPDCARLRDAWKALQSEMDRRGKWHDHVNDSPPNPTDKP